MIVNWFGLSFSSSLGATSTFSNSNSNCKIKTEEQDKIYQYRITENEVKPSLYMYTNVTCFTDFTSPNYENFRENLIT